MTRAAVFLDRDGVLNERPPPHEYVGGGHSFRWIDGAVDALGALAPSHSLIVVSNQRGIARGLVSWDSLRAIEQTIQTELARHGARIDAFYYCPHDLTDNCLCRKPQPGLLFRASEEHEVDLGASVMIGDDETDVEAGRAAGTRTILLGLSETPSAADVVVPSLREAATFLINQGREF